MKRFIVLLLALLLAAVSLALGETAVPERTAAEKELDALAEAHQRTKDLPAFLGEWEERPWYAAWMESYGLSGNYHPSAESFETEEEIAVCDVAYDAWVSLCGITADNDFSIASESYLYEQVQDDVVRQLWLVVRVHDEHMPDFFALVDRDTQKVLATSDVAFYQEALKERTALAIKEREKRAQVIQSARELLFSLYGGFEELHLSKETLAQYQFDVFPLTDDPEGKWYIWAYAPVELMESCPDFYLTTDSSARLIYSLSMSFERRDAEKEWERQSQKQELLETLGDWGKWTIEEKAQYSHVYNGQTCYGVPGENDLPYEEALKMAKDTLLKAYPDQLTQEILDAAAIEPFFFIEDHLLYGTVYEAPFYYFSFLPEDDENFLCYEIILDGKDGQVYLTHDPSSAGNG